MYESAPKYYIVKKHLIDCINREEFPVNGLIPSERTLMEDFGVSRITIRKAIEDLVNEGYLYRVQGKGTYVKSDEFEQDLFSITGCSEDIKRFGMVPSKKLLEQTVLAADKRRIRNLNLTDGDEVMKIARVYYADDEPVNYTIAYLPMNRFPGIHQYDFSKESLYDVIENKYKASITKATRTLEAILIPEDVSELLQMKPGDPLILFRAVTYGIVNGKEVPIENFKSYYRTDKFKFHINQVRSAEL